MRIGIFGGEVIARQPTTDDIVAAVRQTADEGFSSFWLPQIFGADALTTLAVIGREVPAIELGTAVIPTYPRHPAALAAQALTVQAITGGRLLLGIGLSHQIVIEGMFGYSFDKPVRHMREYLQILGPLLAGEPVDTKGNSVSFSGALQIGGVPSPPTVLIAALGAQMLRLAARLADGTITWMTGAKTLDSHTVPAITAAADEAGRPRPRVVAGLPVCITNDVDKARNRASKMFAIYNSLPSYRAMLDREGAEGPADVAIVGDEDVVRAELERLGEVGVTDLAAVEFGTDEERGRTHALLRSML